MSQQSVNAIKVLGVDAINKAKSGHPGVVMGAAQNLGIQKVLMQLLDH